MLFFFALRAFSHVLASRETPGSRHPRYFGRDILLYREEYLVDEIYHRWESVIMGRDVIFFYIKYDV